MVLHHIIDRLHSLQLLLESQPHRLQHFDLHVVQVILDELEHAMAQGVSLLEHTLYVTFLGGLVLEPDLFKVFFGVFALEQMSEDQLVLVDRLLRDDQSQWPAHLVVKRKSFMHLQCA